MPKLKAAIFVITALTLLASCGEGNITSTSTATTSSGGAGTTANYTPTSTSTSSSSNNNTGSSASNESGHSPIAPDPRLTPGDALDVTRDDICVPGYSKKVRNVPQAVKEQAYREYGITSRQPREYEVDHLISLELGGSNSLMNLWPESFITEPWNAHVKDRLENKLHEMICSGEIDIKGRKERSVPTGLHPTKSVSGRSQMAGVKLVARRVRSQQMRRLSRRASLRLKLTRLSATSAVTFTTSRDAPITIKYRSRIV